MIRKCGPRLAYLPRSDFFCAASPRNAKKLRMRAVEELAGKRAYELRDDPGTSDGKSDEFWFAARAELEAREVTAEG